MARKLMEIGYQTRMAREVKGPADVVSHLGAIEDAAEACLTIIRQSIGALSSEWEGVDSPRAQDVIETLKATCRPRRLAHEFGVHAEAGCDLLPFAIASGIVRISREAIHNAEMHSGGTRVSVRLMVAKSSVRLVIEDDGHGVDEGRLPQMLNSNEHLGLRQIRSTAFENGGTCTLAGAADGGLRLDVVMPFH